MATMPQRIPALLSDRAYPMQIHEILDAVILWHGSEPVNAGKIVFRSCRHGGEERLLRGHAIWELQASSFRAIRRWKLAAGRETSTRATFSFASSRASMTALDKVALADDDG